MAELVGNVVGVSLPGAARRRAGGWPGCLFGIGLAEQLLHFVAQLGEGVLRRLLLRPLALLGRFEVLDGAATL